MQSQSRLHLVDSTVAQGFADRSGSKASGFDVGASRLVPIEEGVAAGEEADVEGERRAAEGGGGGRIGGRFRDYAVAVIGVRDPRGFEGVGIH